MTRWTLLLVYTPTGGYQDHLHLHHPTGWVVLPASGGGFNAAHSYTARIFTDEHGAPKVWPSLELAKIECELTCPDCHGVTLPAPCASCDGRGWLGDPLPS